MKNLLIIHVIIFIVSCGNKTFIQGNEPGIFETTGLNTQCKIDSDCWCQYFDGSEFKNKKDASVCCTPENENCDKPGYCIACIYD